MHVIPSHAQTHEMIMHTVMGQFLFGDWAGKRFSTTNCQPPMRHHRTVSPRGSPQPTNCSTLYPDPRLKRPTQTPHNQMALERKYTFSSMYRPLMPKHAYHRCGGRKWGSIAPKSAGCPPDPRPQNLQRMACRTMQPTVLANLCEYQAIDLGRAHVVVDGWQPQRYWHQYAKLLANSLQMSPSPTPQAPRRQDMHPKR